MYQQYLNQAQQSIAGLSSDELKFLLHNDEKLEERVTEALTKLESEKQLIMDENTRLAEKNLTREPELAEQRNIINDLSAQGKDLCARIQEMLAESKSKTSKISQDTAHALLQTAAAESEEQSEQIVKQLMDKELPIEQFLEQFLSARRTMHLRKVKADKMDELARQLRQSAALGGGGGGGARPYSGFYPASTPNAATTPYPPAMGGAHNSAVPYPRGPIMHMPMPGQYPPYPRP